MIAKRQTKPPRSSLAIEYYNAVRLQKRHRLHRAHELLAGRPAAIWTGEQALVPDAVRPKRDRDRLGHAVHVWSRFSLGAPQLHP